MAIIREVQASQEKLSQTFNLNELFELAPGQELRGDIATAIGQEIIDRIIHRTTVSRKDINGNSFEPYSDSYVNSLSFKAFGKSRGRVNLTQSGGMLDAIDILDLNPASFEIGIDDPDEAPKAYNHQVGDTLPFARTFFGITRKELNSIKSEFASEVRESLRSEETQRASDILETLRLLEGDREPSAPSLLRDATIGDILQALFEMRER